MGSFRGTVRWRTHFDELMGRFGGHFTRGAPRRRARDPVLGLLSDLPSKNCWTISEHAGNTTPDGLQHLLCKAVWDHDAVRGDLRGYVVEHLGTAYAVLVVGESGDLKKGTHTVGVQRQYAGAGQPGEGDTNTAPKPATTGDEPKPRNHEDHDLRLPYECRARSVTRCAPASAKCWSGADKVAAWRIPHNR